MDLKQSKQKQTSRSLLGYGALLGIVGVFVGLIAGRFVAAPAPFELRVPAFASSAQGQDNFAVATGQIDDGIEAFFFLDFLTGELNAYVVNTRGGGFGARYSYNISADFANGRGVVRNPKYLMVTGVADIPRRSGPQMGKSLVYITEATSGKVVAYALPFDSNRQTRGQSSVGTFSKVAWAQMRNAVIRDQ